MLQSLLFFQAAPQGGMGSSGTLFFLAAMILVFYFFMIRPQAKKAKDAKTFQEKMGKGDKIVTIAGIHGTINRVNDDGTIQLEVSPGNYMKIEKSAISIEWTQNINKPAPAAATPVVTEKAK